MDLFSVILKDDVAVDPRKYGALLAPVLGVTVVEAKMAVRRGGIFVENLPEEPARRVAAMLEGDGIACWCVPSAALPPLRAPHRVTAVEALPDGMRCTLLGDPEPRLLPWDRIGVVSIGLVLFPELQEEIAGVRKQDVAAIMRREQEQRDLVRDRLLAVLTRVDPPEGESAPTAGALHYFFDRLRRVEALQLKAIADLVSVDGSEWWRLTLEETAFTDRTQEAAEGWPEAANYMAVPILYARRPDAQSDRSRKLLQGGNVERLTFRTVEEFNRHTRWWSWRVRLEAQPELAEPSGIPSAGGNGQSPREIRESPIASAGWDARPKAGWRVPAMMGLLVVAIAVAAGLRFERRGAVCVTCRKLRQDDVVRLWGYPVRETLGEWKATGPQSPYDQIIGKDHPHLYDGFGYEQSALFGFASRSGRAPGGTATPEALDANECANALLMWPGAGQATLQEVGDAYPRLFERVRNIRDPAGRRRWLDLARAEPDRQAPGNLLEEAGK